MSQADQLKFFISLSSSANLLSKKLDRTLGAIHGIGVSDFRVMHELNSAPTNTLSRIELADQVGLTASGITRLLNPMEKIGLVEKQQNDRDARVSLVKLSQVGKERFAEALITFSEVMESSLTKLNSTDQKKLVELLGKIS